MYLDIELSQEQHLGQALEAKNSRERHVEMREEER